MVHDGPDSLPDPRHDPHDHYDSRDPSALLPLTPAAFHILLTLVDGERHGYSIMQEVAHYTGGTVRLGPTTLYRSIKHMLAAGLIEELDERPDHALDDERRRYYRLTGFGRGVAAAETQRLEQLLTVARAKQLRPAARPRPFAGGA